MTFIVDGTNGGFFPSWTTATRPASPAVGQMGYNTSIGLFDQYVSGAWYSIPYGSFGTNGIPAVTTYASGSGTYSVPAGAKYLLIQVQGAGGGGGGGAYTSPNGQEGGGGGGGGYSQKILSVSGLTSGTYVVGASGTGGAGGVSSGVNGNNGGNSTFTFNGTTLTGGGGSGGAGANPAGPYINGGGNGGAASSGDINSQGQPGFYGLNTPGSAPITSGGGGASFLGTAGQYVYYQTIGNAGLQGGGGSGGGGNNTGGNGGSGLIVITSYFS